MRRSESDPRCATTWHECQNIILHWSPRKESSKQCRLSRETLPIRVMCAQRRTFQRAVLPAYPERDVSSQTRKCTLVRTSNRINHSWHGCFPLAGSRLGIINFPPQLTVVLPQNYPPIEKLFYQKSDVFGLFLTEIT